jgi:hypothetical protein
LPNDNYIIEIRGDVLYSKLVGKWDLTTDVQYSINYSTVAQKLRNRPWGILCDMSQWSMNIKKPENKELVKAFDRRNQIVECWVIKRESQVKELKPFLAAHSNINLRWFTETQEAEDWVKRQPLSYVKSD